jgi:hypothetical protein
MKKISIAIVTVFSSLFVSAASLDIFKAVMENPEVQNLSDISALTVTSVYKCPKCYDVKVDGNQEIVAGLPPEEVYLLIRTEGNFGNDQITTLVIQRSK